MSDPHKVPLRIIQGATFDEIYVWKVGDSEENAIPVNLTGCVARAHVREKIESPAVLLQLTTENGRIVLGGASGSIQLLIAAADTSAINWKSGVYDLEIEFPDGRVVRRMYGGVSVSPEVTR